MRRVQSFLVPQTLKMRARRKPTRKLSLCFSTTTTTTPSLSLSSSSSFTDPALEWGRTHPEMATKCLDIPLLPAHLDQENRNIFSSIRSLSEYWKWRKWTFPLVHGNSNSNNQDLSLAQSLVSHVLSAPLTVAKFHQAVVQQAQWNNNQNNNNNYCNNNNNNNADYRSQRQSQQQLQEKRVLRYHWCCVGARAEATLPNEFWKEYLVAVSHLDHFHHPNRATTKVEDDDDSKIDNIDDDDNGSGSGGDHYSSSPAALDITIDFVGPDIHSQTPSTTLTYDATYINDNSSSSSNKNNHNNTTTIVTNKLQLNWLYKGFLHEYVTPTTTRLLGWNGYLLLNPGVGHSHLQRDWEPTLDFIFSSCPFGAGAGGPGAGAGAGEGNLPILMTAHSELDAQRDYDALTKQYGLDVYNGPIVNPFASRVTYEDPFDATHLVQPNHYVTILSAGSTSS